MNIHPYQNIKNVRHPQQSVRRVKEANADMRCLSVKLPAVHEDGTTRDVWWYVFGSFRACVFVCACVV